MAEPHKVFPNNFRYHCNNATFTQLMTIPGIGKVRARTILKKRGHLKTLLTPKRSSVFREGVKKIKISILKYMKIHKEWEGTVIIVL